MNDRSHTHRFGVFTAFAAFAAFAARIAAVAFVCAGPAAAQSYPSKPVRVIVPFAPGGPVDVIARLVQPRMQDALGQPLVIENRTGASGNIGSVAVARSAPDGYTVLAHSSGLTVNPSLAANAGYDAEKDFAPVVVIATQPNIVVVNPGFAAKNLAELIALAKTRPLAFGTPGAGTTPHLTGENLFRVLAAADATAIHFRGAGPAAAAALAGEPPIATVAVTAAIPLVKAGKLRGIAISSSTRHATLPEVPTFAEQGFPQVQDYTWVGLFVPTGVPADVVAKLNDAALRALAGADVKERLAALAFDPVGGTPAQAAAHVKTEVAHWAKVVRATGAKGE